MNNVSEKLKVLGFTHRVTSNGECWYDEKTLVPWAHDFTSYPSFRLDYFADMVFEEGGKIVRTTPIVQNRIIDIRRTEYDSWEDLFSTFK